MSSTLSLTTIPVDILELIVHYASAGEPMGPPRGLLALLSTCRALYYSLSIHNNTPVYGDCFRLNFDISAPLRRFRTASDVDTSRAGSSGLAAEFCARFAALHYMRAVVNAQNLFMFSEQKTLLHLWTIYFMCIESDSKNQRYLFRYGHMRPYAKLCLDQYLFQSLDAVSLLPDTMDRTLMMWISWFSTSWDMLCKEDLHAENKMIQFLRPINYSNFNYNAYFAPWMLFDLPTTTSAERTSRQNRYSADIQPKDRSCTIVLYGAPLRLTPPLMVHASLLSYFARLEKRSIFENLETTTPSNFEQQASAFSFRLPNLRDSRAYDTDFLRMCACLDPRTSPGVDQILLDGVFAGDWEGRFSFTDFDSFRDMLDGDDEAIHSSTIAQQPQVWSVKEHRHPRSQSGLSSRQLSNAATAPRREADQLRGNILAGLDSPVMLGPSLNGHLPLDIELVEQTWSDTGGPRGTPSSRHSPSASPPGTPTRAPPPSLLASYVDPSTGSPMQSIYSTWADQNDATATATASVSPEVEWRRQIAARHLAGNRASRSRDDAIVAGYADPRGSSGPGSHPNSCPSSGGRSFDGELMGHELRGHSDSTDDFTDATIPPQDIILTGKGHSAWGPFVLKGRVRPWDGMVNLVKSYAGNDGRGTWLYRGYILDGGIWVGRWRDTMTEEATNGYEGVFAMVKRTSPPPS